MRELPFNRLAKGFRLPKKGRWKLFWEPLTGMPTELDTSWLTPINALSFIGLVIGAVLRPEILSHGFLLMGITSQLIGLGAVPDDHTGDPLRVGGQKLNDWQTSGYSRTFFAGAATYTGTNEQRITACIAAGVAFQITSPGLVYVLVPQTMLPYNASLVVFNTGVLMLCEGAVNSAEVNVRPYGAAGNGTTDDTASFTAALAYANANVSFFGTSLIATPPVIIPQVTSPSGQTKSYLITSTLALPAGLRMRGTGTFGAVLQFIPTVAAGGGTANNSTLFTFFGTVEAQSANILLENIYAFQNGAAATSIGFRMRNASFIQCRNCIFSNFRVGTWLDWGQDLDCFDTEFAICQRGVQLGGNLTQPEFPQPPAGVRHAPLNNNPWMDNASFLFCKFSQNVIDVNHLGCNTSHGCTLFGNCTFFESFSSPVAGKTQFIHTTQLKGLTVLDSWFEAGADGRTGVVQSAFDYDGNAGAQNLGGVIQGNHFLLTGVTGGSSSVICVDIESGSAVLTGNVFEINALATHVKLADTTRSSCLIMNSYLTYPDTLVAPILNITGKHQILEPQGVSRLGTMIVDDPAVSQIQFNLAQVRKAGISVIAADTLRFFNSVGTVVTTMAMGVSPGLTFAAGATFQMGTTDSNLLQLITNALSRWSIDTSGNLLGDTTNGGAVKPRIGASAANAKAPVVAYQDVNEQTVSTTDTSIGTSPYAMPASAMSATGHTVRITMRGRALTQAASVNVKFGATVLATVAVAVGESFTIVATVCRTSSASQLANITTSHGSTFAEVSASPAETMSNAINIDFRGSVTSGGTLKMDIAQVEILAAA